MDVAYSCFWKEECLGEVDGSGWGRQYMSQFCYEELPAETATRQAAQSSTRRRLATPCRGGVKGFNFSDTMNPIPHFHP
jgi:hypothetical protein